jgi:DNA polymerase-3 subunit gamma/tau
MEYEVTATRRRPQRFEDLAGQEFVAFTLRNSIQMGQIAHAYLFSGPRGCGKTSSARILAKALNCAEGPAATPCGACTTCTEITRGASLDVIEIDGASNTSVNDVRQIKDEILFPPNSSRYKIYIIDEVHMLSTNAFNALLKTIEEPPPYVIFIFATTELHKVPATIKSRCQQFHFRLVAVEQIKSLLSAAAAEIGIAADDEALYWVARESTGSIRDAYTLFDQVASFSEGHITYDKIRGKLGLVSTEQLNCLYERCAASNSAEALEYLDDILSGGVSVEQFVSNTAGYFRSLLFIKNGVTKESLLGQSAERFSPAVLQTWNDACLERALSLFLALYRDIRYSLNPHAEVDLAVSRLCWLSTWVSPAELKVAIEKARQVLYAGNEQSIPSISTGVAKSLTTRLLSTEPSVASDKGVPDRNNPIPFGLTDAKPSQPSVSTGYGQISKTQKTAHANPALTLERLRETAVAQLSDSHAMLAAALSQTRQWAFDDNIISVGVESDLSLQQLTEHGADVSRLLTSLWGKETRFMAVKAEAARRIAKKKSMSPDTEMLCRVFKGTIVETRI